MEIQKKRFTFRSELKIGFRKCWKNEGVKGLEGLMLGSLPETQRAETRKRRNEDRRTWTILGDIQSRGSEDPEWRQVPRGISTWSLKLDN